MALIDDVKTAYRAVLRGDLNDTTAQAIAGAITNGQTTLDAYIKSLIASPAAQHSSVPAVAMASFIQGVTPDSARLDSLAKFAAEQYASYAKMGVGNAALGPFEAFGAAFALDAATKDAFKAQYGAGSDALFVTNAYITVFGSAPAAGAAANLTGQVAYFTSLYTGAGLSAEDAALKARGAVLGQIVGYAFTDAESAGKAVIDNQVNGFLTLVANGNAAAYGQPLPAPSEGFDSTFTLTTGLDNVQGTAGNDLIVGDNNTVQAADQINGGAGIDTFKYYANTGTLPSISNVERINLVNSAADINLSAVAGLQRATIEGAPTGARTVTVAAGVEAGVLGVSDNAKALTFTINGSPTSASLIVSGSSDAGAVNLDNLSITTLNVTSTGASNNKIAALASTGAETTVNVSGDKALTITAALAATVTKVDASANAGGLTAAFGAAATGEFIGGAGNDSIDAALVAGKLTVNLGAGNDTLKIGAAAVNAQSTFDGGAGVDTVQITDGAVLTVAAGKQFTNFEVLSTGAGTGVYNVDRIAGITSVKVDGDLSGNTTIQGLPAGGGVTISADQTGAETLTLALQDATGSSDVVNVKVGGTADVNGVSLITTAIETIKIESVKAASNASVLGNTIASLDVTSAKSLVFSGDYLLNLAATVNDGAVTTIDATALKGGLVMGAALAGTQSVTYLGGDGADTFMGNGTAAGAGDTFKGGKGGDTITLAAAGQADVVIYSAANDSQITATSNAGMDTINGFVAAEDKIDLTAFAFAGFERGVKAAGAITAAETTTSRANFFDVAGSDRGVVYGTELGNTYVFVDANKDGNFDAANDLIIKVAGTPVLTATDFLF